MTDHSTAEDPKQPLLHDSVVQVAAPTQAWSDGAGEMGGSPIHGFYHSDVRIIRSLSLTADWTALEALSRSDEGSALSTFVSLARGLDDDTADPRVRIERRRELAEGVIREQITVINAREVEVETELRLSLAVDFADMQTIKSGAPSRAADLAGSPIAEGALFEAGSVTASVTAPGAQTALAGDALSATWQLRVPPGGSASVQWAVAADDAAAVVSAAGGMAPWSGFRSRTDDSRLGAWLTNALSDLDGLRMVTRRLPAEQFLAAGAPWFFTLFGRDSIWAARLLLPLGTELAASTLRVLAALQGTREVAETAEQPGKIMHELRRGELSLPIEGLTLPPLYYGTVDATALWVILLHDSWKWGMPDEEVIALLPHLEEALAWMRDYGDSDADGFLEYVDTTGHGLANQGWKDSGDSIQWRDGRLAEGPIALCEVQGYAYQAAVGGAELLDRFGRPGGSEWRSWAADLKERFAEKFWIDDPRGAYPAVALDAAKQRVDTVTSNIGHLLGTGILDERGSRLVASRLVSAELASGYGLRTMSSDSAGFWPLSYHGGSVWAHDTAIAILGLARSGFAEEAAVLIDGLLSAADGFGYRMPELHSGDRSSDWRSPVPYPAACRPQAWSAAAAVAVLTASLGLDPDDGRLDVRPLVGRGAIEVDGLRFGGRSFAVSTDAGGGLVHSTLDASDVTVAGAATVAP